METDAGNRYILVMIDVFTKYTVAVAIQDQTARTAIDVFTEHWLLKFGAPHRLLTDQGANFESQAFKNLCLLWKIDKVHTTPYHPAGNGVCERVNKTIKNGLQKTMQGKEKIEWDLYLPDVIFSYNTAVHDSTGFTPFRLMFGEEARIPLQLQVHPGTQVHTPGSYAATRFKELQDTFALTRTHLQTSHKRNKENWDLGVTGKMYFPGDQVQIDLKVTGKHLDKMDSRWSLPHKVLQVKGVDLVLEDPKTLKAFQIHSEKVVSLNPHLRNEPGYTNPVENPVENVDLQSEESDSVESVEFPSESVEIQDKLDPLSFLSKPRTDGKREIKINKNYEFCNVAMMSSSTPALLTAFPPRFVDPRAHYGITHGKIGVVGGLGTCFIHGRTGTYFVLFRQTLSILYKSQCWSL